MILADIEAKLKEIDPNVYYGMVDENENIVNYNYIVFNRKTITHNANKTSASDYLDVHVVRENYVPEGMDTAIIKALCELPGVKSAGDCSFLYALKPNTNTVVEIMTVPFVRARKTDV